jgi:flagellar motor protein MotB
MRELTDIPVGGYQSHETDFATLLARQSQGMQDLVQTEVVAALADAEMVQEAGKFCTVTIVGHSDRVDDEGLTPEQRRADELDVCVQRADSAQAFLFNEVSDLVLTAGGTVPADLASMQNSAIFTAPAGAANLLHTVPASEQEREENRRVQFLVAKFAPEIVVP